MVITINNNYIPHYTIPTMSVNNVIIIIILIIILWTINDNSNDNYDTQYQLCLWTIIIIIIIITKVIVTVDNDNNNDKNCLKLSSVKNSILNGLFNSILNGLSTASHWFWISRSHRFYTEIVVQCRILFWMDFLLPLTGFE